MSLLESRRAAPNALLGYFAMSLARSRLAHHAGSLFSAAFEDPCIAVVGASGGVFGVVGLFIADMIMNFKHIRRCGLHSDESLLRMRQYRALLLSRLRPLHCPHSLPELKLRPPHQNV